MIQATASGDTKAILNIAQIFEVGTQQVLDSGVFALAGNVIKRCIEGYLVNHKRIGRLWREEGLTQPRRRKRVRQRGGTVPLSEIKKSRPCVIISPDEMNRYIRTVIVAPMTTTGQSYPTRVNCRFRGKLGQVVLDQIRTVDKERLVRKLGRLEKRTAAKVLGVLEEMFAP